MSAFDTIFDPLHEASEVKMINFYWIPVLVESIMFDKGYWYIYNQSFIDGLHCLSRLIYLVIGRQWWLIEAALPDRASLARRWPSLVRLLCPCCMMPRCHKMGPAKDAGRGMILIVYAPFSGVITNLKLLFTIVIYS